MSIDLPSTAEWSGIVCLYVGVRLCALSLGYVFFISSFPYRSHANIRCSLSVFLLPPPHPLPRLGFIFPLHRSRCLSLHLPLPLFPVIYPMPWWAARWGWINHVFQNDSSAWKHEAGKGQAALLSFGDLYKMAAPIIIHYEWPWLGGVCVCEWLSFNCPTFCQKHSVASKVVIDGYISVPSHINWWSSMFRSHKEPTFDK